jgi:autoinducer 2-degrading protein
MYTVVVEFHIRPAHIQAFHQAIVANARLSVENEEGCHQFDVCRDQANPSLFYLYEIYDDEAAFHAHLKTAHFLSMNTLTNPWVDSKTVRTLTRVQP